jgi:nucleotide-binding universal stress UspA family protein
MSFKDILVYVEGSPQSDATLALAAQLAKRFQAYLIGLHVIGFTLPSYDPATYLDGAPSSPLIGPIRKAAQSVALKCENRFRDQLTESGVRGEWHLDEGMVADSVAREARYADLAVVTQVDPADPPLGTRRYVPQEVLLSSGRPVLVVPCGGKVDKLGEHILVGWNGSRESARVVNDALPFLKAAKAVTVLAVAPQRVYEGESAIVGDIVPHLIRHGVKAVNAQCAKRASGTTNTLLSYAADCGADVMVVGGYGHSRLRTLILGGVTRGLLDCITLPVLMSH